MDIKRFKRLPIMGILRGIEYAAVEPLAEAITAAGMETIEAAMNTPQAERLIAGFKKKAKGRLTVGAGTVLDMAVLNQALKAGAAFIVMPVLIPPVMRYCAKNRIPVFPGALTPQEVYQVWKAGAAMVKVFPAAGFGPEYFRYLRGPFPEIPLMAVGGVREDNIAEYFSCGARAAAVGESVFKKELIRDKKFKTIQKKLAVLVRRTALCLQI